MDSRLVMSYWKGSYIQDISQQGRKGRGGLKSEDFWGYVIYEWSLCDKFEKVCETSGSENQVLRPDNRLSVINIATHSSEIRQGTSSVVGNLQGINGISSGIQKTDRPTVISCLDSSSIQNLFLISTTNADSGIIIKVVDSGSNISLFNKI